MAASTTSLALVEEAVRLADAHLDADLGFHAREQLMYIARSLLRGDIQAAAFAWCLGQCDRDPERYSRWHIFHRYSSIIGMLANQCDVSRIRLEELLADFGRRLESAGFSQRHKHFTEQNLAPDLGDRPLAESALQAMRRFPVDALSPGPEWELSIEVDNEIFLGRPERAIQLAGPFLDDRARHRGNSDAICAGLLWPLWRQGERQRAADLYRRCMRSYDPQRVYYWSFGKMMTFAARTKDLGRAVKRYAECQRAINGFTDPLTRLHFGVDALIVFETLLAAGREKIAVRLPKDVAVPNLDGHYSVIALRDWLFQQTRELAERFDTRNGTSYWKELLRQFGES